MGNGCQAISNLANQAWILARMYNQDEQADENNTVVTMLNKF